MRASAAPEQLSRQILPNASAMLGACLTGIGLVKIAEAHMGQSHVDEYLAIDGICFLMSCVFSYSSIRKKCEIEAKRVRLEKIADLFFIAGLVAMILISVEFAHELL